VKFRFLNQIRDFLMTTADPDSHRAGEDVSPKGWRVPMKKLFVSCLVMLFACALPLLAAEADGRLTRYADIHGDAVVFTFEGDLWRVPASGGVAVRITRHPGGEFIAKFSPDGSKLAFTASYDGGTDVYVMDAEGGEPMRLTYHPGGDYVLGWTPDGENVLFRSRRSFPYHERIYTVSVKGGMPVELPVDRAGLTTLSPDGKSIAYNRITRERRTWKRYQGGMAQDIWMGSLEKGDFHKITDWKGTDNFPMWQGDAVYFTSDRKYGTLNLYKYDVKTEAVTALTDSKTYDVKFPSIGPGAIVYQFGPDLMVLDLASGRTRTVPIRVNSDRIFMRPDYVDASRNHKTFAPNHDGSALLLEIRGEVVSIPAEEGVPVNLTETSASREKDPAGSPDGERVAFLSDKTGEEEVYLVDSEGGAWKQVSEGGKGFRMKLVWSPDGKNLLFTDKFMRLNLLNTETKKITVIDEGPLDDAWERWGIQDYVWSPCGRWVAYSKMEENGNESIFLYSLDPGTITRVTGTFTTDWSPSFDPHGRYLYFLSNRTYEPIMGMVDQNHVFLDMCKPYVVLLKKGAVSPFSLNVDKEAEAPEVTVGKAIGIDLTGLERRTVATAGVPAGNYFRLEAIDKGFLYLAKSEPEFLKYQKVDDTTGGALELFAYDLGEKKVNSAMKGIANYHLSADGKKMAYRAGSKYGIVDAGSKASVGDGSVNLSAVQILIDYEKEYFQIFDEAWRIQRDWFYDANMHGLDWDAMREKYRKLVPQCGTRSDLNYLIGEMIAELNAGHAYVYGGDTGSNGPRVPTGLLGADFDTPEGAAYHRFARIPQGTSWDASESSPLAEPGCPIREGDYLIAIDGEEVPAAENIFEHLIHKSGSEITLTFNGKPSPEGAKEWKTKTLRSEYSLRYREWVESRRRMVDAATDGRIGYIHIPGMMENGLIEFAKAFYAQHLKEGLIIDVRYNGGGFTSQMIIDRLERKMWGLTQPREGGTLRDPERVFHGPIAVIINEDTGSDGENFGECVKRKGIATVIGMRTWGGSVGIEPHQDLVDGGAVTPPQFGSYGFDRDWIIEGVGVVPQIEVQNMPSEVLQGVDSQLKAATTLLLTKLKNDPPPMPVRPDYPDKSKKAN